MYLFIKLESNPESDEPTKGYKALRGINGTLKWLALAFIILLCNGSIVSGAYYLKYPARGVFAHFKSNDGRDVKVHYLCAGPSNGKPTFMFEADASHGLLDFLGLQVWSTAAGRRSCIWDKPGLGYSDYMLYNDWGRIDSYYHNFITAMNETGPFIFVPWGGGASIVYNYAIAHPEMVNALVFLDVYPENVEFLVPKIFYGWNETYYQEYMKNDINGRWGTFSLINGLGLPWGLVTFFLGGNSPNKSFPEEYLAEKKWYFEQDKTWTTQKMFLYNYTKITGYLNQTLTQSIPLHHIYTNYTEAKLNADCVKQNLSQIKCDEKLFFNKWTSEAKFNMTKLSLGGKAIECTADDCSLGYYVNDDPKYTIEKLIELFP